MEKGGTWGLSSAARIYWELPKLVTPNQKVPFLTPAPLPLDTAALDPSGSVHHEHRVEEGGERQLCTLSVQSLSGTGSPQPMAKRESVL